MELMEKIQLLKTEIKASEEQLSTLQTLLTEEQYNSLKSTILVGIQAKRVELEKMLKNKSVIIEDLLAKLVSEMNVLINKELLNEITSVASNVACLLEISPKGLILKGKTSNRTSSYEDGEYNVIYDNKIIDFATIKSGKIILKSGINSLSMLQTMIETQALTNKEFISVNKERFESILNVVNFANPQLAKLHSLNIEEHPYIICKFDIDKFIRRNGNNKLSLEKITEEQQTEQTTQEQTEQ